MPAMALPTSPLSPATPGRYATGDELILVLNCGSSSIKFALYEAGREALPWPAVWNGKVQGIGGSAPDFGETGSAVQAVALDAAQPQRAALALILARVRARLGQRRLRAVVHRVVHGGGRYTAPVRVDAGVLAELRRYIPLAPLHQPFALEAMAQLLAEQPGLAQIACFDTAFHHTLPRVEQMLPLPHEAWDRGLRRCGFHGLSYEFMAQALPRRHGERAQGRVIVAHLGSGASLCAMQGLRSVATTMGFSALDGLMMGTRSGSIDPGVLLHLLQVDGLSPAQLAEMLYQRSGLLGVSGSSSEPRALLALEREDSPAGARARDALALYVRRCVREIGALVAVLGGLDLLVFTAGVGEHRGEIRERIVAGLPWLGLSLDAEANQRDASTISRAHSAVTVGVEPTNEEWIAATHANRLLAAAAGP